MHLQKSKALSRFAKHLFLASKANIEVRKAREEVEKHLSRMEKSILRMSLKHSDIDKLREKINNLIYTERHYARLFNPGDKETEQLKNRIKMLEEDLGKERESRLSLMSDNQEKIKELTESLNNIKNKVMHLHMEKAKRHQRLRELEQKIREKVDVHSYMHS